MGMVRVTILIEGLCVAIAAAVLVLALFRVVGSGI
jgi:hypothetical protein